MHSSLRIICFVAPKTVIVHRTDCARDRVLVLGETGGNCNRLQL